MGTEICGMDHVFPPDDLWFGLNLNLIIDMAGCFC